MAILNKKGYPPVDCDLSNKLMGPDKFVAYLKTKGLTVKHVCRGFKKPLVDFIYDEKIQPRNRTNTLRYEKLADDYARGWDHYEFPSVVVVKVKNLNWKLPRQVGGFHSMYGAFPIRGWDYAWVDEFEVDSMLDAIEFSSILNHKRHTQIDPNLVTDDVQTVVELIQEGNLPAFDFGKKATNSKIIESIGRIAGDKSPADRENILKKVEKHIKKTDVNAGKYVTYCKDGPKAGGLAPVNSTYWFSRGRHPLMGGIYLPYLGDAHMGTGVVKTPVFDGMPQGFQNILGSTWPSTGIGNAINFAKKYLVMYPNIPQFRIYLYCDISNTCEDLNTKRRTAANMFKKRMDIELEFASKIYPDADQVWTQDKIILAGFYPHSRAKDPDAKGKNIERTILDPVNFLPIDSLTLKPLKKGEY
jgi:hypothetical protein